METLAVVLEEPERLHLRHLQLQVPGEADIVVQTAWSGISTGTERLLYEGRMPDFPGMGYPLVPGYETVGRVLESGGAAGVTPGTYVYVPGARCFGEVRGLFGGAASHLVVPSDKAIVIEDNCIGSGCALCIQVCPFDALSLGEPERTVGDFFGIAVLNEKRCTGCRLCEDSCGWGAIYIDPPRELLKKRAWPGEEEEAEQKKLAPVGV